MKVHGSYEVDADIETVFRWLNDPDVLAEVIPGAESLRATGENTYEATLKIRIGAVRGSYSGKVEVRDPSPPRSFTLHVEGKGPGAFVSADGRFVLSELEGARTRIDVEGDAEIGGVLARVGQRMFGSAAKSLMNKFFDGLKKQASRAKRAK